VRSEGRKDPLGIPEVALGHMSGGAGWAENRDLPVG
jgi:hypothetical protein